MKNKTTKEISSEMEKLLIKLYEKQENIKFIFREEIKNEKDKKKNKN